MIGEASSLFYEKLQDVIKNKNFEIMLGGALLKQTFVYNQSLEMEVSKVLKSSNELSVIYLTKADSKCREHCGQGLLYHVPILKLDEIIQFVTKKDQTLTYFGFDEDLLKSFVEKLNGRGITRIVPFGEALNFDPLWDGQDLFYELTKLNDMKGAKA